MSEPNDPESDMYDELIERNRCHILRYINAAVFFDKLRQQCVLSMNDVEEIQNKGFTRRERAGLFLDKLQTKGNKGCILFLEILEYEYPPLFKLITDKEPRDPPPEYNKHRESFYASWLYKLPQLAEDLKNDYEVKKDLNSKLNEMEKILKYAQENNRELERETEEMRKKISNLKEEKTRTEKQLGECMKEMDMCRDNSLEYLQNCLQFQQERDHYKERWREVILERDDLSRQINSTMQSTNTEKDASITALKALASKQVPPEARAVRKADNQRVQIEILENELQDMRDKCEELSLDRTKALDELDVYQKKLAKIHQSHEKLLKENNQKDIRLEERRQRIEEYFKMIETLEQEKEMLVEEKNLVQAMRKEEAEKSVRYFREKHELENLHEQLIIQHRKLKVECNRDSSGSIADDSSADDCTIKQPQRKAHEHGAYENTEVKTVGEIKDCSNNMKFFTLPATFNSGYFNEFHEGRKVSMYVQQASRQNKPPLEVTLSDVHGKGKRHRKEIERTDTIEANPSTSIRVKANDVLEERRKLNSSVYYVQAVHSVESEQGFPTKVVAEAHPKLIQSSNSLPMSSKTGRKDAESNKFEMCRMEVCKNILPTKWRESTLGMTKFITANLAYPILDHVIHIVGGNYVGIYVCDIKDNDVSKKLSVGDNIVSVRIFNKQSQITVKRTELKGLTHEMARSAFQLTTECEKQSLTELQVELIVVKSDQFDFQSLKEWMKNQCFSGDCFFLRCNLQWKGDGVQDALHLRKGDIVKVISTHIEEEEYWRAQMFDQRSGTLSKEGIIPKDTKRFKFYARHGLSERSEARGGAFRYKCPPYTHVLPTKAETKLPIHLVGDDHVVTAVEKMMTEHSNEFCVGIVDDERLKIISKNASPLGHHVLLRNISPAVQQWCIFIYIDIDHASPEVLSAIFGDIKPQKNCMDMIPDDVKYETISISEEKIVSKEQFIKAVNAKVKARQERLYWMTGDDLDESIIRDYQNLLGTEKSPGEKQIGFERSFSTPALF